jgi:uncharacterized repeat protein (TIGR01451 family)
MRSSPFAALAGVALIVATVGPAQAATVGASGPLSLTLSGADTAPIGAPYPVTVLVTNTTPDPTGSQATVAFATPLGVQLQGAIVNSTGGLCARAGGGSNGALVNCQLSSLAPGASATITFSVVPLTLGSLGLGVSTVDAGTITSAELQVPVAPAPTDVQVTGSASTGSPAVGSTFTYRFQVKDNGPWPAPGVTFSDALPASVAFIDVTTTAGTCSQVAGTVSCAFGDMAVGSQANVSIDVQAPSVAESIANTATVALGATDRQPSNNSVTITVQSR